MVKLVKINDFVVKPVKSVNVSKEDIQGYDLIKELYSNIFICSKKKSGKTSLIYNILKNCANKMTTVIFVCSTIGKDKTYDEIFKMLDKKGINHEEYTSLFDGKENVIERWEQSLMVCEEKNEKVKSKSLRFDESDDEEVVERKPKKIAPEYIWVLDDLSNELGDKSINFLLSRNRHFKSKVVISSQYYQHLSKNSRSQLDVLIIFKNMPTDKLQLMHSESDLSICFDEFLNLYNHATKEKFSFFYIDIRNEEFRKNFNVLYDIQ